MPFTLRRCMRAVCAAVVCVCAAGCAFSTNVTIGSWQKSLDDYSANEANGDLSFLRDTGGASGRPQFAVHGSNLPQESADVTGVLLGRREFWGGYWYVFLVGGVKNDVVQDVRVAVRSDDSAAPKWLVSRDDPVALEKYRQFKDTAWRARNPGRTTPPLFAMGFPAPDDDYELNIAGNTVSVTHKQSGSSWVLVASQ